MGRDRGMKISYRSNSALSISDRSAVIEASIVGTDGSNLLLDPRAIHKFIELFGDAFSDVLFTLEDGTHVYEECTVFGSGTVCRVNYARKTPSPSQH